jgi:hypothetical protein
MKRDLLHDPSLPELARLVDPARMAALFEERFGRDYPAQGLRVEDAQIEKVYYRRRKHCGALYRARLRDRRGERLEHWFYVRHFTRGEALAKFEKASRKAAPPASHWKPVALWPETEMLVFAFPHDPRLAHLPEIANPEAVRKIAEENAGALGLEPGTRVGEVRCRQVKAMPGKRVVLRFELDLHGASGATRTLPFYSKTYGDATSLYVYRMLCDVCAALGAEPGPLEIPRPLLHIDSLHTYWQEEWPGRAMSELYRESGLGAALPRVARALSALHRLALPGLSRAFYVDEVAEEAVEDAVRIGAFLPEDAERVGSLAARIAERGGQLPALAGCPEVPLHGAFRMSQLLERDGRLAMTDFDAVATGDPHYDVAEFQSSLLYQHFRRGLALEPLLELGEAFREAYAACVPWSLDRSRLAWFTSAFLLEKFHGSLKGLETEIFPRVDAIFDLSESFLERSRRT